MRRYLHPSVEVLLNTHSFPSCKSNVMECIFSHPSIQAQHYFQATVAILPNDYLMQQDVMEFFAG